MSRSTFPGNQCRARGPTGVRCDRGTSGVTATLMRENTTSDEQTGEAPAATDSAEAPAESPTPATEPSRGTAPPDVTAASEPSAPAEAGGSTPAPAPPPEPAITTKAEPEAE